LFESFELNESNGTTHLNAMKPTPVMEKFVECWGEMGIKRGVNRTVAQAHAIFYLSPRPAGSIQNLIKLRSRLSSLAGRE